MRVLVTVNRSDTWLQVFNDKLKLEINPNDGYYVRRTQTQDVARPVDGSEGWACELDEQVSVFVNKFRRHCRKHAVVLCRGSFVQEPPLLIPEVEFGGDSMPIVVGEGEGSSPRSGLRIDSVDSVGGVEVEIGQVSMAFVKQDVIVNGGIGEEMEGEGEVDEWVDLEWGRGGNEDDLESLATGVERQLNVLNEKGIPVEEVRAKVEQQVRNCTNKLILGVIADVIKQQEKPSWENLVQKMPSVCHFLDKIVNKSS